jgi:hypothetical protein
LRGGGGPCFSLSARALGLAARISAASVIHRKISVAGQGQQICLNARTQRNPDKNSQIQSANFHWSDLTEASLVFCCQQDIPLMRAGMLSNFSNQLEVANISVDRRLAGTEFLARMGWAGATMLEMSKSCAIVLKLDLDQC